MPRYGMVIDLLRCIGCNACTIACKAENGTTRGVLWTRVLEEPSGTYPNLSKVFRSVGCMHCKNPPCVDVCPTGASFKQPNGIVLIDYDKCMGCRYCEVACPYGARTFLDSDKARGYYPAVGLTPYEKIRYASHQVGVEEKCTFCVNRLAQGKLPACVQTCPAKARYFGDLDDPNSEVSKLIAQRQGYQLLPELGTEPSVYYLRA